MPFEIVTVERKGLLFEVVTVEHKGLLSEIVTVKEIGLEIIFFLLGFLNLEKLFLNCRTNLGKNGNDMATDLAQHESSNIKCYASAFSNIQI